MLQAFKKDHSKEILINLDLIEKRINRTKKMLKNDFNPTVLLHEIANQITDIQKAIKRCKQSKVKPNEFDLRKAIIENSIHSMINKILNKLDTCTKKYRTLSSTMIFDMSKNIKGIESSLNILKKYDKDNIEKLQPIYDNLEKPLKKLKDANENVNKLIIKASGIAIEKYRRIHSKKKPNKNRVNFINKQLIKQIGPYLSKTCFLLLLEESSDKKLSLAAEKLSIYIADNKLQLSKSFFCSCKNQITIIENKTSIPTNVETDILNVLDKKKDDNAIEFKNISLKELHKF